MTLNGYTSAPFCPTSGVPQGSNLEPLLFNIFIIDVMEDLQCESSIYADDAKLYSIIKGPESAVSLQNDLHLFAGWCSENRLDLNPVKCKKMSFYRGRNPIVTSYSVNGVLIEEASECRDLGVIFDHRLSFVSHVDRLIDSARRTLAFGTRVCKQFSNLKVIKVLFMSLVLPRLSTLRSAGRLAFVTKLIELRR